MVGGGACGEIIDSQVHSCDTTHVQPEGLLLCFEHVLDFEAASIPFGKDADALDMVPVQTIEHKDTYV